MDGGGVLSAAHFAPTPTGLWVDDKEDELLRPEARPEEFSEEDEEA